MPKISINTGICTKCNLCVEVCPKKIFNLVNKSFPEIKNEETCIECGHCLAICPANAVEYPSIKKAEVIGKANKSLLNINPVLASIRSVRKFKDINIEENIINDLINTASLAPAASNARHVEFLIINNKTVMRDMEKLVIRHFKNLLKKMNPFVKAIIYLFSRDYYHYIKQTRPSIVSLVEQYENGKAPIFRDPPHVIIIYAPKVNPMSKDNCDGQMHYFRLAAHAKGLGSCVIGYAMNSHKALEKYLKIGKKNKIFGVLTFGYPKYNYSKMIFRKSGRIFMN